MIGQTVSHYKILEKLGGGGMGVVYKARDLKLDRFVALKFLPHHLGQNDDERKRFVREARAASSLDHQNICTVHEIDEIEDGRMFIAMAYYNGETLKKKVTSGQFSVDSAVDIAIQIAEGLANAHERGIVHRDIKPANIMITNDGVVKIVDFGLAKLTSETRLTQPGATIGTVAYMSPEQARGDEVDHRTDIWSLGVVLYEMLTGELPFKGEYDQAVIYSILNKMPEPVSEIIQPVPWQLNRVIYRALEKNPADRFQQLRDFHTELVDVKNMLCSKASPSNNILSRTKNSLLSLWWSYIKWRLKDRKRVFVVGALTISLLILSLLYTIKIFEFGQNSKMISVLVMPFENSNGDPQLDGWRQGTADMFFSNLDRSRYLQLIRHDRTTGDLPVIEATNGNNLAEFADRTGAQFIITGSLLQAGGKFKIIANCHDMRPGGQTRIEQIDGEGRKSLMEMINRLSDRIKVALEIEAAGDPGIAEEIARLQTNSVEAYKYYKIGRAHRQGKRYEEAMSNLTRAIEIDTSFAHAYDELAAVHEVRTENSWLEKL